MCNILHVVELFRNGRSSELALLREPLVTFVNGKDSQKIKTNFRIRLAGGQSGKNLSLLLLHLRIRERT